MQTALIIHLATVLPALALGCVVLCLKKGTATHKAIGRIWVVLMLTTAMSSFFIKDNGSYSWIHILSIVSISSISISLWAIRQGKVRMHLGFMIGAFIGAIIAGLFAVIIPDRFMYNFLFGG